MNKKMKIHQRNITINDEGRHNYLVLVEVEDGIPIRNYLVKIPDSYHYFNEQYPFYMINKN